MGKCLTWAFCLIFVTACSQEELMAKIAPPDQQEIARNYIEQLRGRNFSDIEKVIDPSIAGELRDGVLEKMADLIPAGAPTSVKLIGANKGYTTQVGTTLNLTYEFQFGTQFVAINVALKMKDGAETIIGFNVQPLSASLETLNLRRPLDHFGLAATGCGDFLESTQGAGGYSACDHCDACESTIGGGVRGGETVLREGRGKTALWGTALALRGAE
jgi:hypothetical protein